MTGGGRALGSWKSEKRNRKKKRKLKRFVTEIRSGRRENKSGGGEQQKRVNESQELGEKEIAKKEALDGGIKNGASKFAGDPGRGFWSLWEEFTKCKVS